MKYSNHMFLDWLFLVLLFLRAEAAWAFEMEIPFWPATKISKECPTLKHRGAVEKIHD